MAILTTTVTTTVSLRLRSWGSLGMTSNGHESQREPGRELVAQKRKSRRRRSELRRLSASRKFYVTKNAGLARIDPNYWSLDKVAKNFKLKSPNPVVVLSKHLKARGVNSRPVANGGQDNPLRPILHEILTSHTKLMMLVTDFVKDNAVKIRWTDVAFLPSGVTSDAAMARAELGVNNAKRAVEDAERKRQNKKRKEEDLLCQAIQDAPAILARIESLNDLRACTRAQLITLHRSVLRLHPRWQLKKADLIAALTLEISKEIESRNQHAEPHAELPGVPVPAPINASDAEMLKITHIEPMTETQTSLEPMPMGGKDGV
ncbi:unnamed product [Ostreococcus tauri]|uniref:Unnamed product n=1 Tax=Ostreococcus tauri TaxID=70448 RepID=A0A090MDE3_OSTTA|nr:unnamed product [Ostreococcus tauri]CEG00931.1 unnamed product [Ostreococcus tauri]|eukprot:XP_022840680.1 unnamed product [Ostreococcus tauri]